MVALKIILCSWNILFLAACDRAPREPESGVDPIEEHSPNSASASSTPATTPAPDKRTETEPPPCVQGLAEPPPPPAVPLDTCPEDPQGKPVMPFGTVTFPEAPLAPQLQVELARTTAHRTHGLMFRPTLEDEEGMLFSWGNNGQRAFWMRNTCLALDMLFITKEGMISGILEHVPPMNELSRRIPCPVAHVLEVRAGWTRQFGVTPGQKVSIDQSNTN